MILIIIIIIIALLLLVNEVWPITGKKDKPVVLIYNLGQIPHKGLDKMTVKTSN